MNEWQARLNSIRATHRVAVDRASNRLESASRPMTVPEELPLDARRTDSVDATASFLVPANLDRRETVTRPAIDEPRSSWLV
ncbi:hypothetical protein [Rhodococcoides kyotonense]|uniref:hypothetical protein n=1 Tax=Rhodococcoides kyotonense TaxID=398843 RepID=UPI000B79827F|nr:hypothetical protein [Rhodococcus kyotonensis]